MNNPKEKPELTKTAEIIWTDTRAKEFEEKRRKKRKEGGGKERKKGLGNQAIASNKNTSHR